MGYPSLKRPLAMASRGRLLPRKWRSAKCSRENQMDSTPTINIFDTPADSLQLNTAIRRAAQSVSGRSSVSRAHPGAASPSADSNVSRRLRANLPLPRRKRGAHGLPRCGLLQSLLPRYLAQSRSPPRRSRYRLQLGHACRFRRRGRIPVPQFARVSVIRRFDVLAVAGKRIGYSARRFRRNGCLSGP